MTAQATNGIQGYTKISWRMSENNSGQALEVFCTSTTLLTCFGGQLNLVTDPIYKEKMARYVRYLINEMARLNIDIRLNSEASVGLIKLMNPDVVLLATDGTPRVPGFEGLELLHVSNYRDVKVENSIFTGKKIAVIGSGMVCHSTSRRLSEQGNEVTIIEVLTESARKISQQTRVKLLEKLKTEDIQVITGHDVSKIVLDGVNLKEEKTGETVMVEVDQVVIAMGVQAYNPLEEPLREVMDHIIVIGDAAGNTSLADATRGGFETAYHLA